MTMKAMIRAVKTYLNTYLLYYLVVKGSKGMIRHGQKVTMSMIRWITLSGGLVLEIRLSLRLGYEVYRDAKALAS